MDIAGSLSQGASLMQNASSYNADQGRTASNLNQGTIGKYNNTIANANMKKTGWQTYDKGEAGVSGVAGVLGTAKTIGDARNFDSEVSGFGEGKGTAGYLKSQGQIVKGRFGQAQATFGRALGSGADAPKSAGELGLSQTTMGTTTKYTRATSKTPFTQTQVPQKQTGLADVSKVADTTEEGKAVAKASGGLLTAGAKEGGAVEGGMVGGIIKKAGKYITDVPSGQLSAGADIVGKGMGIFGAGKAIWSDAHGGFGKDTGAEKAANIGDIVAGTIDTLSVAMPMLAPVGAIASGISGLLDIGAEADKYESEKAQAGKVKTTGIAGNIQSGQNVASLGSAGLIAKQQITAH